MSMKSTKIIVILRMGKLKQHVNTPTLKEYIERCTFYYTKVQMNSAGITNPRSFPIFFHGPHSISTSHKPLPTRIIPFYENSVHFTHIFSKVLEGTITIMW